MALIVRIFLRERLSFDSMKVIEVSFLLYASSRMLMLLSPVLGTTEVVSVTIVPERETAFSRKYRSSYCLTFFETYVSESATGSLI